MSLLGTALKNDVLRPALARSNSQSPSGFPAPPVAAITTQNEQALRDGVLELADGTAFQGISFGAEGKSIAGECVFQTGTSWRLLRQFGFLVFLVLWEGKSESTILYEFHVRTNYTIYK